MGGNALNSNDSNRNRFKSCWAEFNFEFSMLILICIFMIGLSIMAALLAAKAHAAACLSIDVPPQVVIHNYDGDTFALFHFGPGGQIDFRVAGVNTPELSRKKGVPDEPGALEAKAFTKAWFAAGPFHLTTCGKKTLTRIEATVERNGRTL